MGTIRGKFRCNAVTYHGDPDSHTTPRTYVLGAVYDQSTPENRRFAQATPWGELQMKIDNPAARLAVGTEYYLDLVPCAFAIALVDETVEDHSRDVADLKADEPDLKADEPEATVSGNYTAHQGMDAVTTAHVGE